ncbi:MAG: cysteine synthase A [Clostridia bacterium]|nr:cysteine synthase A [Clostridia bacterium]
MLKKSLGDLIGNTPLYELKNLEEEYQLHGKLFAKLEYYNLSGSVKDRVAYNLIKDAEEKGVLSAGGTIIEPTSGNTGIGLAAIAAAKGYKAILVMPNNMSIERQKLIKMYGAEVVLTDSALGMQGSINKAKELNQSIENSFIPSQFDNPANPEAHILTTGREIYTDLKGKVGALVVAIGSGGTISGTGAYLKSMVEDVKVIGIEPEKSPLLTKGYAGKHNIQGIGANFVPENLNQDILDEVLTVSDEDSYAFAKEMAKEEGILVGISSGCAIKAGIDVAKRKEMKGKNVVVILADGGDKYMSTPLFE